VRGASNVRKLKKGWKEEKGDTKQNIWYLGKKVGRQQRENMKDKKKIEENKMKDGHLQQRWSGTNKWTPLTHTSMLTAF